MLLNKCTDIETCGSIDHSGDLNRQSIYSKPTQNIDKQIQDLHIVIGSRH